MKLCPDCRPLWEAWLDYRLPPAPIPVIGTGIPSVKRVAEQRTIRFEQWKRIIRIQQGLIERNCKENHENVSI